MTNNKNKLCFLNNISENDSYLNHINHIYVLKLKVTKSTIINGDWSFLCIERILSYKHISMVSQRAAVLYF